MTMQRNLVDTMAEMWGDCQRSSDIGRENTTNPGSVRRTVYTAWQNRRNMKSLPMRNRPVPEFLGVRAASCAAREKGRPCWSGPARVTEGIILSQAGRANGLISGPAHPLFNRARGFKSKATAFFSRTSASRALPLSQGSPFSRSCVSRNTQAIQRLSIPSSVEPAVGPLRFLPLYLAHL